MESSDFAPERRSRGSVSVGFSPAATVFFYAPEGDSYTSCTSRREVLRTKQFDGRSEAMRYPIQIDQIEEFLTLSSSTSCDEDDWGKVVSFPRRTRSYAHHWADLSALVKNASSSDERDPDEESSDTESTRSDHSSESSMWLMENLPCDADLQNIHCSIIP